VLSGLQTYVENNVYSVVLCVYHSLLYYLWIISSDLWIDKTTLYAFINVEYGVKSMLSFYCTDIVKRLLGVQGS